jgi:hypothetical protein
VLTVLESQAARIAATTLFSFATSMSSTPHLLMVEVDGQFGCGHIENVAKKWFVRKG